MNLTITLSGRTYRVITHANLRAVIERRRPGLWRLADRRATEWVLAGLDLRVVRS
jgi:hypothetical protein